MEIKKISMEETWNLRQKVMWPTKSIDYVKLKDDDRGIHYGGFIENRLISVISLFLHDKEAQFRKFATCIVMQNRGYGTQLLEYMLAEANHMGVNRIWCHARMDKVSFYQRFGLEKIGDSFERDGKQYVLMSKYLGSHEIKD
ncbi:GNAT family N-acetyltransferase [Pelosinus sp. sgz500959]|uniref:GNAT family N-acetyltransferase n=1 Tax=Pelosinus sp. sgz500959 TaxID=3242472 RepID=UPI00366FA1DE